MNHRKRREEKNLMPAQVYWKVLRKINLTKKLLNSASRPGSETHCAFHGNSYAFSVQPLMETVKIITHKSTKSYKYKTTKWNLSSNQWVFSLTKINWRSSSCVALLPVTLAVGSDWMWTVALELWVSSVTVYLWITQKWNLCLLK